MIRLRPAFTPDTSPGRQRYARAAATTVFSACARAISLVAALVVVPAAAVYLDSERYTVLAVLSTSFTILGVVDLGIGFGLINAVATKLARSDRSGARRTVSSAAATLVAFGASCELLIYVFLPRLDWSSALSLTSLAARQDAQRAITLFASLLAAGLPLTIAARTRAALQQGYKSSFYDAGGSLVSAAAMLVAIHFRARLPTLAAIIVICPLIAELTNATLLFIRDAPDLAPAPRYVSTNEIRLLVGGGSLFFALQVCGFLTYSVDRILIAHSIGSSAVTAFDPIARLFSVPLLALDLALSPLWPAYADATARHDVTWIERTLVRSTTAAILGAAALSGTLLISGPLIMSRWLPRAPVPDVWLLAGFGSWTLLYAFGVSAASFLNGTGQLRTQLIPALVLAPVSLLTKVVLLNWRGVDALPWAMSISYLACVVGPLAAALTSSISRMAIAARRSTDPLGTV